MIKKKIKNFRLRAKKLFLTYSQIPNNLTRLDVLNYLQSKIVFINEYLIALEKHEDGNNHIHVLLFLNKYLDITSPNYLDLEFEGKIFHGNYQTAKKRWSLIEYLIKEDKNFLTNMKIEVKDGKVLKPYEHLYNILNEQGLNAALKILKERYPEIACLRYNLLKKNFQSIVKDNYIEKNFEQRSDFDIKDFNVPQELINWKENNYKKTLILYGPSGTGKTQLARSFLDSENKEYLLVRNLNSLKNFVRSTHEAIIFDDIDLQNLSREEKIHLLDTELDSQIRILYQISEIPRGTIKIITCNHLDKIIDLTKVEHTRRVIPVHIDKVVYNIQINIGNDIIDKLKK